MKKVQALLLSVTMVASLLGGVGVATAAVIFDNGGPGANAGNLNSSSFQAADDFSLSTGQTTIGDVHWFGTYGTTETPAADDFTIFVYSDSSGQPGSEVANRHVGNISRAPSGLQSPGGLDIFAYSADIAPITLTAGTTYWLSVFDSLTTNSWFWQGTGASNGNSRQRLNQSAPTWDVPTNGVVLAFNLTDDATDGTGNVPEPSSLLLLGSAIAGLGWRRLRKR